MTEQNRKQKGKIFAVRYHDISCGHRVVGHESKCRFLHGHNYRFWFELESPELDELGRVVDFSVIKTILCQWLEDNYDHKTLIYNQDPKLKGLIELFSDSIYVTDFNPTAENLAKNMVQVIATRLLVDMPCRLVKCRVEETRKCSAIYEIE